VLSVAVLQMEAGTEAAAARHESTYAITSWDGQAPQVVKADKIAICVPTKACIQFWFTMCAVAAGAILGAAMMIIVGPDDKLFPMWEALALFCFGILVPSPNYGSLKIPGAKTGTTPPPSPEARGLSA
jgi:hypothetical protein